MTHTRSLTIENTILGPMDFDVAYTVCWGRPAKLWGHPDTWEPGEGDDYEIEGIALCDDSPDWVKASWRSLPADKKREIEKAVLLKFDEGDWREHARKEEEAHACG